MTIDLGISCDSDERKMIMGYATLMVLLLPVGAPLCMWLLMYVVG